MLIDSGIERMKAIGDALEKAHYERFAAEERQSSMEE